MASSQRFGLYPGTLVHAGGSVNLTQLERGSVRPNTRRADITLAGAVDRAHVGIAGADPVVEYATRDLAGFFAGVSGTTGLALTTTTGSTVLRFQERSDAGTFETGATHETYTVREGFTFPLTLTASQDDQSGALLEAQITAHWDGTNDPITRSTGVDFATAPAPAFGSRFFMGPVYHNSAQIPGVTQTTVDFGITYSTRTFDGDPYPKKGSITLRNPTIRFTVAKMDAVAALNMFGRAVTTSFAVYFWKGVADGTRVAVASTVHTKISCTAGHWGDDTIQAAANDDGSIDVIVMPTSAVTISTASAIP